jgi:phosphate transport system substrate-binding protein
MNLISKLALALVGGLSFVSSAAIADVKLSGAGASFPAPLYQRWVTQFQEKYPTIKIDYQSSGSGAGIKAITDKTVNFAGSDAPLSTKQIEALQGAAVVQFPATIGAVVPIYNLPGVSSDLNFTGELLSEIFAGKISTWNDAKIAALNPDVTLPATTITPAWRTDGSGTTFVFTNYLASQSPSFKETIGTGTQVQWPVGQGGKGNPGVTAVVKATAGAIGYVELNYATANSLTFGAVKNNAGKFVKASTASISEAAKAAATELKGPVMASNLWNRDGEATYPIAAFTYLIAYQDLSALESKAHAQALVDFFAWGVTEGQKTGQTMDYGPLAPDVQAKVLATLAGFTYKGETLVPAK